MEWFVYMLTKNSSNTSSLDQKLLSQDPHQHCHKDVDITDRVLIRKIWIPITTSFKMYECTLDYPEVHSENTHERCPGVSLALVEERKGLREPPWKTHHTIDTNFVHTRLLPQFMLNRVFQSGMSSLMNVTIESSTTRHWNSPTMRSCVVVVKAD